MPSHHRVSAALQRQLLVPVEYEFGLPEMKAQQRCKIEELRQALVQAGAMSLDQQAAVLGLSRSTTWSMLRAIHKNSGLSASIINRMLASPQLPASVRHRIFEYVQERMAGRYGHSERRRREFAASLAIAELNRPRPRR
jgi:hypothetical protein